MPDKRGMHLVHIQPPKPKSQKWRPPIAMLSSCHCNCGCRQQWVFVSRNIWLVTPKNYLFTSSRRKIFWFNVSKKHFFDFENKPPAAKQLANTLLFIHRWGHPDMNLMCICTNMYVLNYTLNSFIYPTPKRYSLHPTRQGVPGANWVLRAVTSSLDTTCSK